MTPLADQLAIRSLTTFHERVEMMCLAFVAKHGQRPKLVFSDARLAETGRMSAFVSPDLVEDSQTDPRLAALAALAGRAWRAWTTLEPDEVVVHYVCQRSSGESAVLIGPRSREWELAIAAEVAQ